MIRRPAVTLIEVLIAMFIMAIGMLALLTLFPLGAVSMAQALKDDRCASTAAMAESVAIAANLRTDAAVTAAFLTSTSIPPVVYVDPYGTFQALPWVGFVPAVYLGIPRVAPTFALTAPLADRLFSLPDDIGFNMSGTPDIVTTGGSVDRGRRYSYAYLLKQLQPNLIQEYVVVYSGRPVNTLAAETTFTASPPVLPLLGTLGTNAITLLTPATTLKRGGWILDTTPGNNYFYRVTNLAYFGGTTTVEVQPNLIANVTQVTILDNVAEVFDKGTNSQP